MTVQIDSKHVSMENGSIQSVKSLRKLADFSRMDLGTVRDSHGEL